MSADIAKINAAAAALDFVEDGMLLGLGTGSTAAHFVRLLGERVKKGLNVRGVPTSEETDRLAREVGVPLVPVERVGALDLAVDGADEVDGQFRLIKGGGAALLREKIIAGAAKHFVVIADESKMVETLGAFPLPVEVTPFGFTLTAARIYDALKLTGCKGAEASLRESAPNTPVVTDGGNYIIDCRCLAIPHPEALADALKRITGVVDHGLFLGMARTVIIGKAKGAEVLER
ncbi:MAG: ribose-5-phosphate isomerase RpiA [Hyphomonadaceae bacterium]|nr:MAG: ribose 5-phosphate isomerase A [Caulobacteraceae bacterium]MBT9447368.1 ribose-5-phosphate isomerase RpiA [Hyphomonadaceae bacterium]TPW07448.1 MAG: ribose 5-phosphate isomerase A [Alphaproteobacteria bacterium]